MLNSSREPRPALFRCCTISVCGKHQEAPISAGILVLKMLKIPQFGCHRLMWWSPLACMAKIAAHATAQTGAAHGGNKAGTF